MSQSTTARGSGLLSAFSSLVSGQLVATGAGFVFWVLAAWLATPASVGVAAAGITMMALIGKLTSLGLGTLLIEELPRQGTAARRLFASALLMVMAASLVAGTFVAGAAIGLQQFDAGGNLGLALIDPLGAVLFVLGCVGTTAAAVADQAVLGLNKAGAQVTRNVLASLLRFPLLAMMAATVGVNATGLLASWAIPVLLSLVVMAARLRLAGRRGDVEVREARLAPVLRHWRRALAHHWLNLAMASAPLLVPVVASAVLSPEGNGKFIIAWQIATFIFVPPFMLATALFSSAANQSVDQFAVSLRRTLPLAVMLSLFLCIMAWVGGGLVLGVFGAEYGDHATVLLWLLAPAGLWMVFKDHLAVLFRIEGRFRFATGLAVGALALELTGAVLGGILWGATGLVVGWLVAQGLAALLVAPQLARLVRLARSGRKAPRPLLVSDCLVADPVEGSQVVARQIEADLAAQGARVVAGSRATVPEGAGWIAAYALGWIPLRMLGQAMTERPSTVVLLPHGGLNGRTLLHAVLLAAVTMRKVRVVALHVHRPMRWPLGLIAGWFITALAGNVSDRAALRRWGVQTELFVPDVDPGRVCTLGRSEARQLLDLPDQPTYLHVGHARHGRNLHALAPLAQRDQLMLVLSPYREAEPGSYPNGANVQLVRGRVDVGPYYRAADVYVFAVVDQDSVIAHPLSIDEALANGLPVVARRGPVTEYWEGDPRVTLTDSDEELVAAAQAVMAYQIGADRSTTPDPVVAPSRSSATAGLPAAQRPAPRLSPSPVSPRRSSCTPEPLPHAAVVSVV